jgi:hypothetical protein
MVVKMERSCTPTALYDVVFNRSEEVEVAPADSVGVELARRPRSSSAAFGTSCGRGDRAGMPPPDAVVFGPVHRAAKVRTGCTNAVGSGILGFVRGAGLYSDSLDADADAVSPSATAERQEVVTNELLVVCYCPVTITSGATATGSSKMQVCVDG